jgi:hypothetical protein
MWSRINFNQRRRRSDDTGNVRQLWYITARSAFFGPAHRDGWWENGLMGALLVLSVWGAYQSIIAIGAASHSSLH